MPQSNVVEGMLIKYLLSSDETGMADLALYVMDGTGPLPNGEAGTLWFALAVPDLMAFKPGGGGSYLVTDGMCCVECGGSGRCFQAGADRAFPAKQKAAESRQAPPLPAQRGNT